MKFINCGLFHKGLGKLTHLICSRLVDTFGFMEVREATLVNNLQDFNDLFAQVRAGEPGVEHG
jgi:hypothetical protein